MPWRALPRRPRRAASRPPPPQQGRRPRREVPDLAGYLALWSAGHGGYDARGNALVHGWLRLTFRCAVPAARRNVPPDLVTALGVVVCALVPACAAAGAGWPVLAVPLIVASGLVDGVDGAVAVLTGRVTAFGAVLDGLADRVGEALYVLALWLLGAPGWLCAVGGGLAALQEYTRARAAAAGMAEIGVVTVWERPTRIVVTAFALGLAGAAGLWAPSLPGPVTPYLPGVGTVAGAAATVGAAAWVGLGAVGLVQLLVVVRRRLR